MQTKAQLAQTRMPRTESPASAKSQPEDITRTPHAPEVVTTGRPRGDSPRFLILWAIMTFAVTSAVVCVLFLARHALLLIYVSALLAIGFSPLVQLLEQQRLLPIGTRRLPRWFAILTVYLAI